MSSPEWTICTALKVAAADWAADNWADAMVEAHFRIEHLNLLTRDENPIVVGFLPTTVEELTDREARRFDEDLISVVCVVMARLDSSAELQPMIDINEKVSQLRKRLQKVHEITVGDEAAERDSTSLTTTFDSKALDSGVWASAITCAYTFDGGSLGGAS